MRIRVLVLLIAAAGLLSGCAGQRYTQQINRLKADVGLLDQRVSQLERTSLSPPSATAWPATEPETPPSASTTAAAPAEPGKAAPAPMLKPSKTEIQQALKAAGFYQGSIDGKFGPLTREAVKEFQRINGLKVDGIVGKQTWAKLAPYLDLSSSSGELSAAEPLK